MLSSRMRPASNGCRTMSRALGRQAASACSSVLRRSAKKGGSGKSAHCDGRFGARQVRGCSFGKFISILICMYIYVVQTRKEIII